MSSATKQRRSGVPTVPQTATTLVAVASNAAPPPTILTEPLPAMPPGMKLATPDVATLELPIGEAPAGDGYHRKFFKVELRLAGDRDLSAAFNQLFHALNQGHYSLANGRHIDSAADVFRYLLEQYRSATAQAPAA